MAQPMLGSVPAKLSFAKIAAMPAPSTKSMAATPQAENKARSQKTPVSQPPVHNSNMKSQIVPVQPSTATDSTEAPQEEMEDMRAAIQGLSLVTNGSSKAPISRSGESGDGFEEDQSEFSTSSGNKAQSFDTKSMASVTTFAMDDKESIRPDDSASVRAAEEDAPPTVLSRNSSFQHEAETSGVTSRAVKTPLSHVHMAARRYPTLTNPPRFGTLPISPVMEASDRGNIHPGTVPILHIDDSRPSDAVVQIAPDEKLLDALASPKDRLSLLQLEERVLSFIGDERADVLDLPPQNSFSRLLAHKLADYYSLDHHINDDNSSVRIFGSSCHALPVSLATLAKSIPVGLAPLPAPVTVKIMRRAQLGARQFSTGNSTGPSSSVASKTTSENGTENNSDEGLMSPSEGTPNRDKSKLTREEREAQYKAARERIFGDFQESPTVESISTGENSASLSRSSSTSGKKKSKKHRQPKDDSFEARSAFIPSYAPIGMHQASGYPDSPYQSPYPGSPNTGQLNPHDVTPTQMYAVYNNNVPYGSLQSYNAGGNPAYSHDWQQMSPQQSAYYNMPTTFPYQQHSQVMSQMADHYTPSVIHPGQGWTPTPQQSLSPGIGQSQPTQPWANPASNNRMQDPSPFHQYGQFPQQHFNNAYAPQHPIPGSYSSHKSLFNPQTRSFVPSNAPGRSGGRHNRKKNQNRNGSVSGAATPLPTPSVPFGRSKEDSLQQKYGTPASLPKKPPPSEVHPSPGASSSSTTQGNSQENNTEALVANGMNN